MKARALGAAVATVAAVAVLGTLAVLWAPAGTGQTFGLTDQSGEELFMSFCAACHGESARGDGPVAATLNVRVPDLTRLAARNDGEFPADAVRDVVDGRAVVVAHGPRTMPVWGYEFFIDEGADITAERDARELIARLVRYVESLQEPESNRSFR